MIPSSSSGTRGQILVSDGINNAPVWITPNTTSGTIVSANYIMGTTQATIMSGTTADVPGVTYSITLPTDKTTTLLFIITSYATQATSVAVTDTQGIFSLVQNSTKIASAYASSVSGESLFNLPIPATLLRSVTISSAGTYTFKVQYAAWSGNQVVNNVASAYTGYNFDNEAMLTKMIVFVYNN